MPIYEYHCDACNNTFEEWRRHADDLTETPCPACRKTAHRLISNTSFVLKGGGWYVTEYGNRKAETPAATATGTHAPSPAPETKTDAAPPSAPSGASSGTPPPVPPAKAETATAAAS